MSRLGVSCALATGIAFIANPMAGIVVGLGALTAWAAFSEPSDTPSLPNLPALRPDIRSVAPRGSEGLVEEVQAAAEQFFEEEIIEIARMRLDGSDGRIERRDEGDRTRYDVYEKGKGLVESAVIDKHGLTGSNKRRS